MSNPKFTVAICGGGVGGLALAVALSAHPDIQVDVYEAAHQFAEIGAGIGMWPRVWKIMQALGLQDDLSRIAVIPPDDEPQLSFYVRKGDEPQGVTFQQLVSPGGMISFHRPDFQAALLRRLSSSRTVRTHTSKRLVSYSVSPSTSSTSTSSSTYHTNGHSSSSKPSGQGRGGVRLSFQDGTHATADLLVGADGVKSAVRACMLGKRERNTGSQQQQSGAQPVWSGTVSYRATIPAELLRSRFPGHRVLKTPHVYLGTNSELTVYPIARGRLINLAIFRARYDLENTPAPPDGAWVKEVSRAEMAHEFAQWEPEVQALLDCVQTFSRWAVPTVVPLQTFVSGRVVLLGDAAHAMMPYQGSGAGQAIEDAYILATLLAHPHTNPRTLPHALQVYDAVRRPAAQRVAALSRENGILYTLNHPGLAFPAARDRSRDRERLEEVWRRIHANWTWAWETTVDADVERAVGMLEACT